MLFFLWQFACQKTPSDLCFIRYVQNSLCICWYAYMKVKVVAEGHMDEWMKEWRCGKWEQVGRVKDKGCGVREGCGGWWVGMEERGLVIQLLQSQSINIWVTSRSYQYNWIIPHRYENSKSSLYVGIILLKSALLFSQHYYVITI